MRNLEVFREGAALLNLDLSVEIENKFILYSQGLAQWNRQFNLTSSTALYEVATVHFLDSLTLIPTVKREMPEAVHFVDVGAGAGFPSLPIKLFMPQMQLKLIEVTRKKSTFLSWLITELGLEGVEILAERAEVLARDGNYREMFDIALARALGPLATVLELTLPFCRVGGLAITPRGKTSNIDLYQDKPIAQILGGKLRPPEPVTLPALKGRTTILITEKLTPTEAKYPRRNGLPRQRPIRINSEYAKN
jgi:16S rRNA (guanine527-N7)-methyltransferase